MAYCLTIPWVSQSLKGIHAIVYGAKETVLADLVGETYAFECLPQRAVGMGDLQNDASLPQFPVEIVQHLGSRHIDVGDRLGVE